MRSVLLESPADISRSVGFPRSENSASQTTLPAATRSLAQCQPAQPARNTSHKGRWFVTMVIGSLMTFVAISLWNAFFHYQAYGNLEGTLVRLSASSPSLIRTVHVSEGELVEAGQLLAELESPELELQRSQVNRQLQLASTDLLMRVQELHAIDRQSKSQQIDRKVRQLQLQGEVHLQQARLEELANTFENYKKLNLNHAVSQSEWIAAKTAYQGHKAQLDDLSAALQAFQDSADLLADDDALGQRWREERSRLDSLQSDLTKLDLMLHEAREIRAPVAGRVVKQLSQPGEHLQRGDSVFEIVQSDSVEAVIYLPQSRAQLLSIGDKIQLVVKPLGTRRTFQVKRIAPQIVAPPASLQSKYAAFKGLVRVHAKPTYEQRIPGQSDLQRADLTSLTGGELLLPRFGYRTNRNSEIGPISQQMRDVNIQGVE